MIDKRVLFKLMDYVPHELVWKAHDSPARFRIIHCPRQSGKSLFAAREVAADLLQPGKYWWLVGPEYSSIKEFDYIVEDLVLERGRKKLGLPPPTVFRNNPKGGDMRIHFKWGSKIVCKSCEKPSSLQGEALDGIVMSESAQVSNPDIWHRYLRSTLSVHGGRAIFPTTPDVRAMWLCELSQRALAFPGGDWAAFNWPVTCNPVFPREEYEKALKEYGANHPRFREQWLGEWVFYTGRVHGEFQQDTHVIPPFAIPKEWRRIRVIDFGHRDPFVCLHMAIGPDKELYIYREYYQEGEYTTVHAKNILASEVGEHISMSLADPSAKQLIADLSLLGIKCTGANTDRRAGRERVGEYLHLTPGFRPKSGIRIDACEKCVPPAYPKLFVFSTCPHTIHEFMFYRWAHAKDVEGFKEKTEGPDHAMDTVRYAVMARPSPTIKPTVIPKYSAAWLDHQDQLKRDWERSITGNYYNPSVKHG